MSNSIIKILIDIIGKRCYNHICMKSVPKHSITPLRENPTEGGYKYWRQITFYKFEKN